MLMKKGDRVRHPSHGIGTFERYESHRTGETTAYVAFDAHATMHRMFRLTHVVASNLSAVSPATGREGER